MEEEDGVIQGFDAQGPRALCIEATTVTGSMPDTEDTLIGQRQWEAIRQRHALGQSIAGIGRDLELDRKTVRLCLRQQVWAPYRRKVNAPALLDAHRQWLSERAPQVNYSARVLHQELRQRGFGGCYELVKLAVRPLRAQASVAALTQRRFETAPGEQAQVDWGQISVYFGAQRVKVHVLVMTLGYSRRAYGEGFLRERMPDLLAAHENAFAHFGGRCECLLYDRMRTVVLGSSLDADGRSKPRLNATFEAFARHWGFTARLCQPYRAQTKGKVESGVKYLKGNFAVGRVFRDLEDFNAQLAAWQAEVADVRIHGTTHQRPIDRFAQEAAALVPTGAQPSFLQAMVRDRVVAEDWLVSVEGNRYSVPFGLIGKTVQVLRQGATWVIRHRGQVVTEHAVLAGRACLSVHPEHGPGAAARNARLKYSDVPQSRLHAVDLQAQVQVRELAVYDQLIDCSVLEAA